MAAVTSERFADLLASLDAGELAGFVADVWSARGWETRVEGETVVATDGPLGREERIACVSPDRWGRSTPPDDDADVVVTTRASGRVRAAAAERGARFVGPDGLRDVVLYAIDRDAAERIFAARFGRPLAVERTDGRLARRLSAGTPARALGVGVLLLLLAGVVLVGVGGVPLVDDGVEATSPGRTAADGTGPEADGAEDGSRADGGDGVPAEQYPPGLGPDGVTDVDVLATAHGQSLVQSTYDLLVVHEGSRDVVFNDREWVFSRQTVERVSATHYWYRFAGVERTENGALREVVFDDYADETYDYRRIAGPGTPEYRRGLIPTGGGNGLFTAVAEAYIRRYLSTDRSRVEVVERDAQTMFRVVATGTPRRITRTVSEYRAVAVVDWVGRVHRLSVTYTLLDAGQESDPMSVTSTPDDASGPGDASATVEFELVYRDVGETSLDRPPWYDEARNATNQTAVDLWPTDRRWWTQPIGIDYGEDR